MILLAADEGGAAALAALCSGVGIILGALFAGSVALIRIRGSNSRKRSALDSSTDAKKESVVVVELRRLIDELKAERGIDREARIASEVAHGKCEERVQALEEALDNAHIPLRKRPHE